MILYCIVLLYSNVLSEGPSWEGKSFTRNVSSPLWVFWQYTPTLQRTFSTRISNTAYATHALHFYNYSTTKKVKLLPFFITLLCLVHLTTYKGVVRKELSLRSVQGENGHTHLNWSQSHFNTSISVSIRAFTLR